MSGPDSIPPEPLLLCKAPDDPRRTRPGAKAPPRSSAPEKPVQAEGFLRVVRLAAASSYAGCMGSSDRASSSLGSLWVVLVLSLGALLGIGAAAALLGRRDRAQAEDPDAPLFI